MTPEERTGDGINWPCVAITIAGYVATTIIICGAVLVFAQLLHHRQAQADPVPIYVEGDFDFDEDVDLYDFAVFQRNFTAECGGGP